MDLYKVGESEKQDTPVDLFLNIGQEVHFCWMKLKKY